MNNIWIISETEKGLIESIISKGKKEQEKNKQFAVIGFDDFYKLFDFEEIAVIKKFLSINPKQIKYTLPFIGVRPLSEKLLAIDGQVYISNSNQETIPCQYLPESIFRVYEKMNNAIEKDIGKKLLILYGYRSSARQTFLFFDILHRIYGFDFNKTLRRVCFPDYSEHVCTERQAIDFMTEDGIKGEGFEQTEEYQWLKKNAEKFNFYESYPKNNTLGMMYEPWHWHYTM